MATKAVPRPGNAESRIPAWEIRLAMDDLKHDARLFPLHVAEEWPKKVNPEQEVAGGECAPPPVRLRVAPRAVNS
jgi:hypothetical protein